MVLENTDMHFISDFSLPEMKILSITLAHQNVAIHSCSLNYLIQKHKNTPQDKCPLVFDGNGGHIDGVNDYKNGKENQSSHAYKDEYTVQDYQTDKLSYYTIAQKYPDNFARISIYF